MTNITYIPPRNNKAKNIKIEDVDNNFQSNDVEGALKELAESGGSGSGHTHINKPVLDTITQEKIDSWDDVTNKADKTEVLLSSKLNDDGTGTDELWSANKVSAKFNTVARKTIVEDGKLYLLQEDGTKIDTGTTLPTGGSGGGVDGREIELQKSATHIQWRYVGDSTWINLITLDELKVKGDSGITPNIQIGTVETLDSGSNATASISGSITSPLLNLGIPKGADGGGNGGKIWTLVKSITTTEEVSSIEISTDSNGNAFLLSDFVIYIKSLSSTSFASKGSIRLTYKNNFNSYNMTYTGLSNIFNSPTHCVIEQYKDYDIQSIPKFFKKTILGDVNIYEKSLCLISNINNVKIESITSGMTFPIGTTLEVWR